MFKNKQQLMTQIREELERDYGEDDECFTNIKDALSEIENFSDKELCKYYINSQKGNYYVDCKKAINDKNSNILPFTTFEEFINQNGMSEEEKECYKEDFYNGYIIETECCLIIKPA